MKILHGWVKIILCSALLMLFVSCASLGTYIPTDSSAGSMNVKEARNLLGKLNMGNSMGYRGGSDRLVKISDVRVTSQRLYVTDEKVSKVFLYSESFLR